MLDFILKKENFWNHKNLFLLHCVCALYSKQSLAHHFKTNFSQSCKFCHKNHTFFANFIMLDFFCEKENCLNHKNFFFHYVCASAFLCLNLWACCLIPYEVLVLLCRWRLNWDSPRAARKALVILIQQGSNFVSQSFLARAVLFLLPFRFRGFYRSVCASENV